MISSETVDQQLDLSAFLWTILIREPPLYNTPTSSRMKLLKGDEFGISSTAVNLEYDSSTGKESSTGVLNFFIPHTACFAPVSVSAFEPSFT